MIFIFTADSGRGGPTGSQHANDAQGVLTGHPQARLRDAPAKKGVCPRKHSFGVLGPARSHRGSEQISAMARTLHLCTCLEWCFHQAIEFGKL